MSPKKNNHQRKVLQPCISEGRYPQRTYQDFEELTSEILRKRKQTKDRVTKFMLLFATIFAVTMFGAGYHNLDLLHNYAMIFNDINQGRATGLLDLRDMTDCNAYGQCPGYQRIYLNSKAIELGAVFVLIGVIITLWNRQR